MGDERRCVCGEPIPLTHFVNFTCRCGRQYERPRVNLERLVARVDEQERQIKALGVEIETLRRALAARSGG